MFENAADRVQQFGTRRVFCVFVVEREGVVATHGRVNMTRRAHAVGARACHEGRSEPFRRRDIVDHLLEEHMAVGHLESRSVFEVDLPLAQPVLDLRDLDGNCALLQGGSYLAEEGFHRIAGGDGVVRGHQGGGFEIPIAASPQRVGGTPIEVELEFRCRIDGVTVGFELVDLFAQDRARCDRDQLAGVFVYRVGDDDGSGFQPRRAS